MPASRPDYFLVAQPKQSVSGAAPLIDFSSSPEFRYPAVVLARNLFRIVPGNEVAKAAWIPISQEELNRLATLEDDLIAGGDPRGERAKASPAVTLAAVRYALKSGDTGVITKAVTDFRFDSAVVKQSIKTCIVEMLDAYLEGLEGHSVSQRPYYLSELKAVNSRKDLKAWIKANISTKGVAELSELMTIAQIWNMSVLSVESRDLQDFYKSGKGAEELAGSTTWYFQSSPATHSNSVVKAVETKVPEPEREVDAMLREAILSRDPAVMRATLFDSEVELDDRFVEIAQSILADMMPACKQRAEAEVDRDNSDLIALMVAQARGDREVSAWLKRYDPATHGVAVDAIRLDLIFIAKLPIILTEILHELNVDESDLESSASSVGAAVSDEDSDRVAPAFKAVSAAVARNTLPRVSEASDVRRVLFIDHDVRASAGAELGGSKRVYSPSDRLVPTASFASLSGAGSRAGAGAGAGAGASAKGYLPAQNFRGDPFLDSAVSVDSGARSASAAKSVYSSSDRFFDGSFTAIGKATAAAEFGAAAAAAPTGGSRAASQGIFAIAPSAEAVKALSEAYSLVQKKLERFQKGELQLANKSHLTELFNEILSLNCLALGDETPSSFKKTVNKLTIQVRSWARDFGGPEMLRAFDDLLEGFVSAPEERSGCGL